MSNEEKAVGIISHSSLDIRAFCLPLCQLMTHNSPADFDSLANSGGESTVPSAPEITSSGANRAQLAALEHQVLTGARWFYWIAGLSLINTVLQMAVPARFQVLDEIQIFGLGTTQFVDVIAGAIAKRRPELAIIVRGIGLTIDFILAGAVALFGWLGTRRKTSAFVIGMVLYLLDGLPFLLFQGWYGVGIHAFALCCIWHGLSACRKLNALEAEKLWSDEAQLAPAVD